MTNGMTNLGNPEWFYLSLQSPLKLQYRLEKCGILQRNKYKQSFANYSVGEGEEGTLFEAKFVISVDQNFRSILSILCTYSDSYLPLVCCNQPGKIVNFSSQANLSSLNVSLVAFNRENSSETRNTIRRFSIVSSPYISHEIPANLNHNLVLFDLFNRRLFSHQNKNVRGLYIHFTFILSDSELGLPVYYLAFRREKTFYLSCGLDSNDLSLWPFGFALRHH